MRLVFGDAIDFNSEFVSQIAGTDDAAQRGAGLWDALTGYTYEVLSDLELAVRSNGSVDG